MQGGYVVVDEGLIQEVTAYHPGCNAEEILDVSDDVIMPGIIDPHVHINEPGRTDWEGFETATRAAVSGGIIMLVDMPLNASPVTTTVDAFEKKLQAAHGKIYSDVGFWGGVIPGNQQHIEPLIKDGVLGFKAFLSHSGIDEFANVTEADLRKVMPILAHYNLPLLVHCELTDDVGRAQPGKERVYCNYLATRPPEWEDNAIALMIRLCEEYNCPVHIVHLSSATSIGQIAAAKQKGLPLTVETAQHYLYFAAEDISDGQTAYKCAPPIRDRKNNDQLWVALQNGIIDFVATDHSPAPPAIKQLQSGDFINAWGGIASVQFALPALWTAAQQRNMAVEKLAGWLCTGPATLAGVGANRGRIQKGYRADLVIWNPEEKFTVTADMILHKHKVTPYLNHQLSGVTKYTYLQGQMVLENGAIKENKGKIILRGE